MQPDPRAGHLSPAPQAYKVPKPRNSSQAYFPHILIKNTMVAVDFAGKMGMGGAVQINDRFNGYPPWQVRAGRCTEVGVPGE